MTGSGASPFCFCPEESLCPGLDAGILLHKAFRQPRKVPLLPECFFAHIFPETSPELLAWRMIKEQVCNFNGPGYIIKTGVLILWAKVLESGYKKMDISNNLNIKETIYFQKSFHGKIAYYLVVLFNLDVLLNFRVTTANSLIGFSLQ